MEGKINMKKIIIALLVFVPLISFASFDKNLYYGIRGSSDVQELQEFLTDQGVYTGPITGNFFSLTLKGVKAFQTRESISPISGYFGPISRGKANIILASETLNGLTDESGTPISPATTSPSTTDDVVAKLNEQIAELKKNQEASNQQTQTLTDILGQIQQNTAPKPVPPPPPPPEVKKELKIISNIGGSCNIYSEPSYQGYCLPVQVQYFENGTPKNTSITIFSDDNGKFRCENGEKGNPLTCSTQSNIAYFSYGPDSSGVKTIITATYQDGTTETANIITRTITATANGITTTKIGNIRVNLFGPKGTNPTIQNLTTSTTEIPQNYTNMTIGKFGFSNADEDIDIQQIIYESDIKSNSSDLNSPIFTLYSNSTRAIATFSVNIGNHSTLISGGEARNPTLIIKLNDAKNYVGTHTFTITGIKAMGVFSGSLREVSGLPITFTFEIK